MAFCRPSKSYEARNNYSLVIFSGVVVQCEIYSAELRMFGRSAAMKKQTGTKARWRQVWSRTWLARREERSPAGSQNCWSAMSLVGMCRFDPVEARVSSKAAHSSAGQQN